MTRHSIHLVTGRLAEHSLRSVMSSLSSSVDFDYTISVLPITVAALMTPQWIARHIRVPHGTTRVLIPGYCQGELAGIEAATGVVVERGPRDLLQLPEYFGQADQARDDYGGYDIEILAEINHVPQQSRSQILAEADRLSRDGADVIDVGCDPGDPWGGVADCVKSLRDAGHRVSIDSMNVAEIEAAVRAGAELVLSVNQSNCQAALDWGCEVVVIPDEGPTLGGLDPSIQQLASAGIPMRLDPVLEPIGHGLAASLQRYHEVQRRYPAAQMLMGIGNLTELTDVDSAGVNVLLLAVCQELAVRSVLTTQVINWAQTSVRECDLARRLVHYAVRHQLAAKHLEPDLVMLRDPKLYPRGHEELARLARQIKDSDYRIFAEGGSIHLIGRGLHLHGDDPFALFEQLMTTRPKNLDSSHAFYLGYELSKATTALTLGKQYRQDEALRWGMLTREEASSRKAEKGPQADVR